MQSQISQHHFKLDLVLPLARKALCNNFMILVSVAHMMHYCDLKHQQQWLHQTTQLTGIQSSDMGLVQAIADNFNANITSPDGLSQPILWPYWWHRYVQTMKKVRKALQSKDSRRKMSRILHHLIYQSPSLKCQRSVLPLKVWAQQRIRVQRSKFHDFDFWGILPQSPPHQSLVVSTQLTQM